eukprot:1819496-Pyramimonas_sp.AAC.1
MVISLVSVMTWGERAGGEATGVLKIFEGVFGCAGEGGAAVAGIPMFMRLGFAAVELWAA